MPRLKSAKAKGTKAETRIARMFNAAGFPARRQPLSGALADWPHDVQVKFLEHRYSVEVKARGSGTGFAQLDRWRGRADMLVLIADREAPKVYMPLDALIDLLARLRDA